MNKQEALKKVIDGACIHADNLTETVRNGEATGGFAVSRTRYVKDLRVAVAEISDTRFDESDKVSQRVRDLDLAESVALLHAVQDHIRNIAGYSRLA